MEQEHDGGSRQQDSMPKEKAVLGFESIMTESFINALGQAGSGVERYEGGCDCNAGLCCVDSCNCVIGRERLTHDVTEPRAQYPVNIRR